MNDDERQEVPRVVRSEQVFDGLAFRVTRDEIEEQGQTYRRDVVRHAGSACILPLFNDDTIALVRQYRHAAGTHLLEIPAGTREDGEPPEVCARREVEEEIGYTAGTLALISAFYPTPGFVAEKMWLYLATDLRPAAQRLDEDEIVEVVRVPLRRALTMIGTGEIQDAKTIIALALFASHPESRTGATIALSELRRV